MRRSGNMSFDYTSILSTVKTFLIQIDNILSLFSIKYQVYDS